jgi:hypothetical protein
MDEASNIFLLPASGSDESYTGGTVQTVRCRTDAAPE